MCSEVRAHLVLDVSPIVFRTYLYHDIMKS
jgi:hypothetical protein